MGVISVDLFVDFNWIILCRKFRELKNHNDEVDVESDDCDIIEMVIEEPKEKWDCESILSMYFITCSRDQFLCLLFEYVVL